MLHFSLLHNSWVHPVMDSIDTSQLKVIETYVDLMNKQYNQLQSYFTLRPLKSTGVTPYRVLLLADN